MKTNHYAFLIFTFFAAVTGRAQWNYQIIGSDPNPGYCNTLVGASSQASGPENWFQFSSDPNNRADYNAAYGYRALRKNISGDDNTAIGAAALDNMLTGEYNTAIGRVAMRDNTSGSNNTAVGGAAIVHNDGSNNLALGYQAGFYSGVANNNVFLGRGSGMNLQTGDNNVFLGPLAGASSENVYSNRLYIHNGTNNNPLIYGEFDRRYLQLNVFAKPESRVKIVSYAQHTSGLNFEKLKASSPAPVSKENKFLTVDDNGDVILETVAGGGGGGIDYSIYTHDWYIHTDPDHLREVTMKDNNLWFNTKDSGKYGRVYIGEDPGFVDPEKGDYRLFVEGGILTERLKVALRNSADWADYVFADNYKLMPLADVEKFVKANRHLPGVKSSEKLAAEGIDVAQMQSKQMEKIEELTLYAIEQEKTINTLNAQVRRQSDEIAEMKAKLDVLLQSKQ